MGTLLNDSNLTGAQLKFFTTQKSTIIITKSHKKNFIYDFYRVFFYFCGIQVIIFTNIVLLFQIK